MNEVTAGPYTLRGVSIGGVETSIQVPQLGVLLDVGAAYRRFAAVDHVFLSHGHGDHAGCLGSWLGVRELLHRAKEPPRVYVPAAIADDVAAVIDAMRKMHRHDLQVDFVPVEAGDELQLRADLWVRPFRTHHPVPSLGYQFFDRVDKLKPEYVDLPGPEIGRRRKAGEDLFDTYERLELAYATDTLVRVLDTTPSLLESRVLVLECSFLDEEKPLAESRAGGHIHLDELLEMADAFDNEHLVLMHFSLLYSPARVREILRRRCPPHLLDRIVVFAPPSGRAWQE